LVRLTSGERRRDFDHNGDQQNQPRDPDHNSERFDEYLIRDAVLIEPPTQLVPIRYSVRQRPANEVPQCQGETDYEDCQQPKRGDSSAEVTKAPHGPLPCSAVAVPVPVTVK
jgi:hypothetical protein